MLKGRQIWLFAVFGGILTLPGSVRLLRLLLTFCYGFVTGQTSISLPFYRDVTGVTAQREGEGGVYHVSILHVSILFSRQPSPLLHSTENSEEPVLAEWSPGGR